MVLRKDVTIAVFFLAGLAAAHAGESWTIDGRTYSDVRVAGATAGTVTIFHREGISQLELKSLPPELQARFNFDAAADAEWKEKAAAELAATAAARQRREQERIARAHAEAEAARSSHASAASAAPAARVDDSSKGPTRVTLQAEVDLRPLYEHHGLYYKNQGRRPSCAIFAAVSAIEYELARTVGLPEPLSEEFVIWAARELRPGLPIDDGLHFQDVMAAIRTHGLPSRSQMPNTFGIPLSEIRPTPEAIFDAKQRRDFVPVWYPPGDAEILARIVYSLNNDTPVVAGLRWPHWRTLQNNNLLRDQKPLAGAGHAVTLIGYRCEGGNPENLVFLFRNSYGIDWGLGGCGFIAAAYLKNNLLAAFHISTPQGARE
ncbi:MAG: C1 family peptidase [Opitutaceae bacterium]